MGLMCKMPMAPRSQHSMHGNGVAGCGHVNEYATRRYKEHRAPHNGRWSKVSTVHLSAKRRMRHEPAIEPQKQEKLPEHFNLQKYLVLAPYESNFAAMWLKVEIGIRT
eukprot:6483827-Amphidinium_carterae.1